MSEPYWLRIEVVIAAHRDQIAQHGGTLGLRDRGLLESALARPLNLWAYEQATLPRLAAAYAFGLAKNHPFLDGNKRIALTAAGVFLRINGLRLIASEPDTVITVLRLAAGEIGEEEFADWIAANVAPVK